MCLKENKEKFDIENKDFKTKIKSGMLQFLNYFGIFAVSIIFWELLLRFQIGGNIKPVNLPFLLFVPTQAAILAAINGIFPKKVNKILLPLTLLIVAVYYGIQLVYYRIFGSLLSVYLLGMGTDAVGNFGWAMKETIIKSIGFILLLLLPAIAVLVLCLTKVLKPNQYHVSIHFGALVLAAGLWFAAVGSLGLFGTGRSTAYYAFHSSLADTDTAASRLGTMTTTLVEAGSYYLGIKDVEDKNSLETIDVNNLLLTAEAAENVNSEPEYHTDLLPGEMVADSEIPSEPEPEPEPEIEKIPYVYNGIDFDKVIANTENEELRNMYTYFANRTPTTTNEYTGLLEDYNLIYICAESYWSYAIDERVTPTLYKMSQNGIILNNYYNSFRNTTTNGEYAFSTSLWPDMSRQADQGLAVGSMPQSSDKYMPFGLGDMFSAKEISTFAFHNYYGFYYRRQLSYPNLGYENVAFMGNGMKFTSAWPASDLELIEQSVDKYIDEDQFFTYYMTFSGHGPYNSSNYMYRKNIAEVKNRLGDDAKNYNSEALGYFAGNLELEYAMEYLVGRLEEAGKMDKTLIVITGDHYPYYLTESGRASLVGEPLAEKDIYKSSCIMYTTGLEEPIVSDVYCCNVDIVPTIFNLYGINFDSRLLMGTDIFSDGIHKAVLYDKSFITDKVRYDAKTGDIEWKIDPNAYDWEHLDSYIESMNTLIDSEFAASVNIVKMNFYFNLWKDANLLTEDEIIEEQNRAVKVKSQMAQLNVDEQNRRAAYQAKQAEEAAAAAAAQAAQENPAPTE